MKNYFTMLILLLINVFLMQKAMGNTELAEVECAESYCPSGVALFVKGEAPHKLRWCTAFLYSEEKNVVATSKDCLQHLRGRDGEICGEKTFFLFPKTGALASLKVGCERVLGHDNPFHFALVKLKRAINRVPLRSFFGGPRNPKKIFPPENLWSFRQGEGPHVFKLVRSPCRVVTHREHDWRLGRRMTFYSFLEGCRANPGSTGAPILDENFGLRGLFRGELLPTAFEARVASLKTFFGKNRQRGSGLSLATDLSCLKVYGLKGSLADEGSKQRVFFRSRCHPFRPDVLSRLKVLALRALDRLPGVGGQDPSGLL